MGELEHLLNVRVTARAKSFTQLDQSTTQKRFLRIRRSSLVQQTKPGNLLRTDASEFIQAPAEELRSEVQEEVKTYP